jgi:hypothetical protein
MTVSSPMSAQAKGELPPIVTAAIQMPKAMRPIEIRNENAAFMLASIPKEERSDANPHGARRPDQCADTSPPVKIGGFSFAAVAQDRPRARDALFPRRSCL